MKNRLFSLAALFTVLTTLTFVSCKDDTKAKGIKLNKETLSLSVGGAEKLQATVDPADWKGSVKWTSADPAVATVDAEGNVKAITKGATTITAQAGGATAACAVTVGEGSGATAKGIKLNKETLSLSVGGAEKLQATVDPADWKGPVKWTSADPAVATVDAEGNVKAIAKGATTITAQADAVSAICAVTVTEQRTPAGIALPGGDEGKPVDLTLEILKNYIWDYTASPRAIVYKGDKPMVIDLWAEWCGPCKVVAPTLAQLAADFKGKAYVAKAKITPDNANQLNELGTVIYKGANPLGFKGSIPYFILLAPGKPVKGLSNPGSIALRVQITAFFNENITQ